jgi:predicted DCC family thiol-disulfide oxidoreductase YuxK
VNNFFESAKENKSNYGRSIVLYDGSCNFCNASVQFIFRHDRRKQFDFIPLQSAEGKTLLVKFQLPEDYNSSLVLIEKNSALIKSTAALHIAKKLAAPVRWLYLFIIIPVIMRDKIYDWIAKHRHSWFRKQSTCLLPEKKFK